MSDSASGSPVDIVSGSEVDLGLLERRFSRLSNESVLDDVVYEFTKDPALLEQFYHLRRDMYLRTWGLSDFPLKDADDTRSHTLILRVGRQCVGGVRMIIRTPRSRKGLPMEQAGVSLENALEGVNLKRISYCEISRLARLPEYRGFEYTLGVHCHLRRKALAHDVRYAFILSPGSNARMYRRTIVNEAEPYHILDHVKVPEKEEYEGIRMMVSAIDYAPAFAAKEAQSAPETIVSTADLKEFA